MALVWKQVAETLGISNTEKLSGIGTDGQYHHNGVPSKFVSSLRKKNDFSPPFIWDPGINFLHAALFH